MAFVLELHTSSSFVYLQNYVVNVLRKYEIAADVAYKDGKLIFTSLESHNLEQALDELNATLPASLFLKKIETNTIEANPTQLPTLDVKYPLSLGLCPSCQKEMLDVSSSRYYYPFTSCNSCGANHSFVQSYPYTRQNSSFKFLVPCQKCQTQQQTKGKKEQHHINSCHECGVPVRLTSKSSERYANDAGSFRTMFEVAAKAIADNKKLLVKTTMGYRVFYKVEQRVQDSLLMMINANTITENLSLITEEFQALLSIERPVLHVALKSETLKELYGLNTAYVKYPDDGFSILLCVELQKLGFEYIAYEEATEASQADLVMDYDLEVHPQTDMRYFLNKDTSFIASGERVSFPSTSLDVKNVVSIANGYVGMAYNNKMVFDKMQYFDGVDTPKVNVLEGDTTKYHSNQKYFLEDEASMMSVIAEHNLFGTKNIGVYFEEIVSFLYYDGKSIVRVVPPKPFQSQNLLENIASLREGSDRLVQNLQTQLPEVYARLKELEQKQNVKLFEAVAIVLGLDDISMRGVVMQAMRFVGKGGIQIDMKVKDNRFDNTAFLASIISYKLAGVSNEIIAYSLFESLGDYVYDIIQELQLKTKATQVVICGGDFANQSLFSRIQRNFKLNPPYMNKHYPIGKENCVVGGVYL